MRAKMVLAVIASLPLINCAVTRSEEHTSRDIGSRRQLFIDDYMIASMHGLKRSFHPAKKHPKPVMIPEHPWEGVGTADWPSVYMHSGDVIFDEQKRIYRMWYSTATKNMNFQHDMLYATSKDGIHWHKPLDLNIANYDGSGANNILVRGCGPQNVLKMPCNLWNEGDPQEEQRLHQQVGNLETELQQVSLNLPNQSSQGDHHHTDHQRYIFRQPDVTGFGFRSFSDRVQ